METMSLCSPQRGEKKSHKTPRRAVVLVIANVTGELMTTFFSTDIPPYIVLSSGGFCSEYTVLAFTGLLG